MKRVIFLQVGISVLSLSLMTASYAGVSKRVSNIVAGPKCFNGSQKQVYKTWRAKQKEIRNCVAESNKAFAAIVAMQTQYEKDKREGKKVDPKVFRDLRKKARRQRLHCDEMRKDKQLNPMDFVCEKTPGFRYGSLSSHKFECSEARYSINQCKQYYKNEVTDKFTLCLHRVDYKYGLVYKACDLLNLRQATENGNSLVPIWQDKTTTGATQTATTN